VREIKLRTISLTSHRRVVQGAGYRLVRHRSVWLLALFKRKEGQSVPIHCCDGLRRSVGRPFVSAFAGIMDGAVGTGAAVRPCWARTSASTESEQDHAVLVHQASHISTRQCLNSGKIVEGQ
jgi:hypothetical protein